MNVTTEADYTVIVVGARRRRNRQRWAWAWTAVAILGLVLDAGSAAVIGCLIMSKLFWMEGDR